MADTWSLSFSVQSEKMTFEGSCPRRTCQVSDLAKAVTKKVASVSVSVCSVGENEKSGQVDAGMLDITNVADQYVVIMWNACPAYDHFEGD